MSVAWRQGRDYQRDLFDEAHLKVLRHGAPGDGETGTGVCKERQALMVLVQQPTGPQWAACEFCKLTVQGIQLPWRFR